MEWLVASGEWRVNRRQMANGSTAISGYSPVHRSPLATLCPASSRHDLLGQIVVGINVLDIVILVETILELDHFLTAVGIEIDVGGRDVAGLGAFGGDLVILEGLADDLEDLGVAGDLEIAFHQLDVIGPGLESDF